jgi:hypothetical protein
MMKEQVSNYNAIITDRGKAIELLTTRMERI